MTRHKEALLFVAAVACLLLYLLISCVHQSNTVTGWDFAGPCCSQQVSQCSTNQDPLPENQSRTNYYVSQISRPLKFNTKCTLIAPTYKRVRMLTLLINNYCNMSSTLQKIVVVWNDIDNAIPPSVLNLKSQCQSELEVIHMTRNKLSNRFLPGKYYKEIKTECVFIMDDDTFVSPDDMKFALESWQIFRTQIVGFEGRAKSFVMLKNGSYLYGYSTEGEIMNPTPGHYGIMLPAYFVHKAYLEMLFDPEMVPQYLLDYTDAKMNCEDILFTMMVTKFLRDANIAWSGGLAVEPKRKIMVLDSFGEGEHSGLVRRPGHTMMRTGCLNKFAEHFGKESLVTSRVVLKPGSKWADYYFEKGNIEDYVGASDQLWT